MNWRTLVRAGIVILGVYMAGLLAFTVRGMLHPTQPVMIWDDTVCHGDVSKPDWCESLPLPMMDCFAGKELREDGACHAKDEPRANALPIATEPNVYVRDPVIGEVSGPPAAGKVCSRCTWLASDGLCHHTAPEYECILDRSHMGQDDKWGYEIWFARKKP